MWFFQLLLWPEHGSKELQRAELSQMFNELKSHGFRGTSLVTNGSCLGHPMLVAGVESLYLLLVGIWQKFVQLEGIAMKDTTGSTGVLSLALEHPASKSSLFSKWQPNRDG